MGFDPANLDKAFTSERDGKPFKIRYNVGGGRGSVDPVVFEQDGVAGKKQVGFTGGKVEEVDDATYKDLWAGKKPANMPAGPPTGPDSPQGGRPAGADRSAREVITPERGCPPPLRALERFSRRCSGEAVCFRSEARPSGRAFAEARPSGRASERPHYPADVSATQITPPGPTSAA